MDNLTNVVKSNFAPVVLVITSPDAENVMKKNGITLVKLLTRFGFSPQQTKVKSIGEQPYDIRGFQVRFCSLQELETRCVPSTQQEEQANQFLSQVASYHASDRIYFDFKFRGRESIINYQKSLQLKDPAPWYTYYRWEFLRSMGVTEIECFEHPVACLLVVSSDNEKPSDTLVSLYDDRNPPAIFKTGVMDPAITKYYLMIHDLQSEKTDLATADKRLASMKVTFEKSKCHFVKVNSQKEKNANGNYFSNEDMQSVELFSKEFIFKGIIPQLEKAVLHYNDFVESSTKGLGNKINRWLGIGNKKPSQPALKSPSSESVITPDGQSGTAAYPLGSLENTRKRLGDYLFMLQDYFEALNIYKNASKDFLNDKSWKYYAASQELAGLCSFLMDPHKKDSDFLLENAFLFYTRDNINRHSVRATIFYGDILKMRKSFSDSAQKFIRSAERESDRDKLCAALFQEQAAFCYMNCAPPQYRKYAFRLILAGHLYSVCSQNKHSYRCYSSALSIYENRNWTLVDDQIYSVLAKQSFVMDRIDDAVYYIQKLLGKNAQPAHKQASILREFIFIYKKRFELKAEKLAPIPVPLITNETISVFLRDYPPKSPLQEKWKEMEKSLKLDGKFLSPAMRARRLKQQQKTRKSKPRLSVIGEPIYVDFEIKNPLQIPLQFTHVQLVASHESVAIPPTEPGVVISDSNSPDAPDDSPFSVGPFEMLLAPNEARRMRIGITPKKEGLLSIDGLGFCLCNQVWGFKEFKLPRRRLNDTPTHRKGVFYEPNMDLTIRVTRSMPLLDIEIQKFPTHVIQGQIEKVIIVLRNTGSSALRNVKVKMSDPSFFSFASTPIGDYAVQETNKDPSIAHIPITSLPPNNLIEVPMWLRGNKLGVFSFHFLFYYESEIPDAEMKYRLQRITKQTRVLPSFVASATANLSYSSINAYLLNLEVTNNCENTFRLMQLTSVSPNWAIEPLSQRSNTDGTAISRDETTSLFFRIVPAENKQIIKEQKTQMYHTHNYLIPEAENNNIVNPLLPEYDFLLREKSGMESPKKDTQQEVSMLDLMLKWETVVPSDQVVYRGVHNVCNISFMTQTVDKVVSDNVALRFSIESPRKIAHDFSKQSLCVIPVTFHVNNVSATTPLSFYLETLQPHEQVSITSVENATPNFGTQKRSQYFWAETTQHYVSDLRPFGKTSLQTCVVFSRPGVYNLNRYKFSLKDERNKAVTNKREIYSPFQHIIMVEEKNEVLVMGEGGDKITTAQL